MMDFLKKIICADREAETFCKIKTKTVIVTCICCGKDNENNINIDMVDGKSRSKLCKYIRNLCKCINIRVE